MNCICHRKAILHAAEIQIYVYAYLCMHECMRIYVHIRTSAENKQPKANF